MSKRDEVGHAICHIQIYRENARMAGEMIKLEKDLGNLLEPTSEINTWVVRERILESAEVHLNTARVHLTRTVTCLKADEKNRENFECEKQDAA